MNGKISKESELHIERNGVMKPQFCPHNPYALGSDNGMTECGDWCPLFGEIQGLPYATHTSFLVELCEKRLIFNHLEDSRKVEDGKD
jgi:hypothetical protein